MTTQQIQPTLLSRETLLKNKSTLKLAAQKQRVLSFIQEDLVPLKDNWDGYNGVPIEKNVLSHLEFLIHKLPDALINTFSTEAILPNSNGTISIEWSKGVHELFLEIGNDYATYYIKHKGEIETMNNHFMLSNNVEFRQFIKYLKSYFLA